jgi:hypothetical protein
MAALHRILSVVLLLSCLTLIPAGISAGPPVPEEPVAQATPDGLRVSWQPPPAQLQQAGTPPTPPTPPTITVRLPAGADAAPQLLDLAAAPWYGDLPETAPPTRTDIDGTVYPPLPDFTPGTLPNAPISLVREGWLRGIRLGVYTINPVYLQDGQPLQIGRLTALIPDAEPLDQAPQPADNGPFLAAAPAPDPAAAQAGWRIRVTAGGIQSLDAATLIAAGLDPASVDVSRLQLHFNGNQIAMHEIRSGGSLTALRFYAPAPSDRWNSNDSYWLRLGSSAGLRMNSLAAAPAGGPVSTTALERGVWRDYVSLESRLPGPDGDTFFSADLGLSRVSRPRQR